MAPVTAAPKRLRNGSAPAEHMTADVAIPVTIEPSTVRSGMLSVLKERKIPSASTAYIVPSSMAPRKAVIVIINSLLLFYCSSMFLSSVSCDISSPRASAVSVLI